MNNTPTNPIIVWFRQDLRLSDNPALLAALETGRPLIPLYILEDEDAGPWLMGAASRVWTHHSLLSLNKSLNGHLVVRKGPAADVLNDLLSKTNAVGIYWNRCYEPWRLTRDTEIKTNLSKRNIDVQSHNGSLLWEPWTIKNQSGAPYKVFTPFYKKGCMSSGDIPPSLPTPKKIDYATYNGPKGHIEDLNLIPEGEGKWPEQTLHAWEVGEDGARQRLDDFLENGLAGYKEGRDFPARSYISRLSPHLHHGEISPRQVWNSVRTYAYAHNIPSYDSEHFCSELGWREFSYSLLYHIPTLPTDNIQEKFNAFPWREPSEKELNQWRTGRTGYPIVDAAMRELYQTGFMHNRCRMIVGSFLVKHMLCHWHYGEKWFWDCLFDADLANNSASWQWIAGCGADAAPYFRIFNPITQGEKFDPCGGYIRQYVPELSDLNDKYIHKPWTAPENILKSAGIILGKTYPNPMVDHSMARNRALEAFQSLKDTA